MLALAFLNQSLLKKTKRKKAGEEVPACDSETSQCFTEVPVARHRP